MPNGLLTPLGRQLRSVLADLGRSTTALPQVPPRGIHSYHVAAQVETIASSDAHAKAANNDDVHDLFQDEGRPQILRGCSRKPSRRPDHIGRALSTSGTQSLAARPPPSKFDLSLANPRSKTWRRWVVKNVEATSTSIRGPSLDRILSRYIEHVSTQEKVMFNLEASELAILEKKGYKLEDVQIWASALVVPDSLDATTILDDRLRERDWRAIPFVVFQSLLRRQYIKPAALRMVMQQTQAYFHARYRDVRPPAAGVQMLFITFVRLLRHARNVWPQAIESLAEMFLSYLPNMDTNHAAKAIAQKTLMLNKAMDLMSRSSAVQPLKDMIHQETAVFRTLRYMAEHKPPIMLTRSGYRAVVRVQLSEKKSATERQWAELKALSWPPWKVDRTGKDSSITPEHGISRAGVTLARMRDAGYAPQAWEKAAAIYAGWDLDGTPSIQTRASADLDTRSISDDLIWAARIKATRTAQEAWGAYLAFENADNPSSQIVYLAIFEKLFAEERRQREQHQTRRIDDADQVQRGDERLLAGDSKEISPPPSSSHLHTYTRTPPPSVFEFFETLETRGVIIGNECLAFIVRHAASLQLGFRYLQYGRRAHPGIENLLSFAKDDDEAAVPEHVVTALIELLCRYSGVSLHKVASVSGLLRLEYSNKATLDGRALNPYHAIVCAMEILRSEVPASRTAYNTVLRALCRDSMRDSVQRLVVASERVESLDVAEQELEKNRDLLTVYRLVGRTLSIMDAAGVELDALGTYYLCFAVENFVIACWKVVKYKYEQVHDMSEQSVITSRHQAIVTEVKAWLRRGTPLARLKHEFGILIGQKVYTKVDSKPTVHTIIPLPRLLNVPHPWLMHAYIRAIGWMGDHEALIITMEWMVEHHKELAEQMAKDRNGKSMMRKVLVAFRTFLERSWLSDGIVITKQIESRNLEAVGRNQTYLRQFEREADLSVVAKAKRLVNSVDGWHGWPSDEEVDRYCRDSRFLDIRQLYH